VQVDLSLTAPQDEFVFSQARFPAFVGGFGSGKTEALVARCLMQKMRWPGQNQGYFAPTYDLMRLIAWPRFEAKLDEWGLRYRLSRADGILYIQGMGQIIARTLDTPERIVGFEIADAVIDELDTLKPQKAKESWEKIIARCRQTKPDGAPNTAAVGTTPEGFRFVYDRWVKGAGEEYKLYRAPSRSNPFLPKDYIASLEASSPPPLLRAYVEGEFVNLNSGSVYPNYDRHLNGTDAVANKGEPLHVGMDFNVLNMCATIAVIREGRPYVVGELTGVADTPTMARMLRERYAGHSIMVYPDASGQSRKSSNAQETDHSILRQNGMSIVVDNTNPAVRDRVNCLNSMLLNDRGDRRLLVNADRAPRLAESLEQQAYDRNGEPDKATGHDHTNDALGYFITKRFPITRPVAHLNLRFAG
jgi:phage terminase large subunit